MNISRALQERNRLVERINSAFHMAQIFYSTSKDLTQRKMTAFASVAPHTPRWVKQFGEGYAQALMDRLYREHLVFGGTIQGVFYSTHSDRPDYYGNHGFSPSVYADDGKVKNRGHYWRGDTSKPFFIGTGTNQT